MTRLMLLMLLLFACNEPDDDGAAQPGLQDSGSEEEEDDARQGPDYSGSSCPSLEDGTQEFATGDTSYDVQIVLPPEPDGAPVLFAWHWLGGNASQVIRYLELDELAADENVIIVAPRSDDSAYEWHFAEGAEGNPDLLLFEDLLSCLWQQFDVDLDRIHATGMSAGGLWSSYLTVHEADWLASTAPLSGGSDSYSYTTPASPIPVLLTWGGSSDLYGTYSFEDASLYLSEALREDGHFVVECVHDDGHSLPPWGISYVWEFFEVHPRGVDPEPWSGGLPSGYPSGCRIP